MSNRIKYLFFLTSGLVFFLVHSHIAFSQDNLKDFLVDGEIWTNEGDTIFGKLIYINQFNCQFNISLSDTSGKEISHYSPKDIYGFGYSIQNEKIDFISMQNPLDLGRIFMRVLYRGHYTLYQFLEINYKSTVLSFIASYFIWDKEWINPPLTQQYEMESLLYHFSDCPELEYKIKTQAYRLANIKEIILEYEDCKLTDEYEFFYE